MPTPSAGAGIPIERQRSRRQLASRPAPTHMAATIIGLRFPIHVSIAAAIAMASGASRAA
jgi:hypothetical protein